MDILLPMCMAMKVHDSYTKKNSFIEIEIKVEKKNQNIEEKA